MIPRFLMLTACLTLCLTAFAQTIIHQDDFSAGTLTGYTTLSDTTSASPATVEIIAGTDFGTLPVSVPSAPNGSDTRGLYTRANISNSAHEAINIYWDTEITATLFEVQVDVFLNFAPSGTTEHAGIGLFASGTKANWSTNYEVAQNTDTDGLLFAFNSDNDEARSSIYLTLGSSAGLTDVGTWANPAKTTPLGQSPAAVYYDSVSGVDDLWGKQWNTVRFHVEGSDITVYVNDLLIVSYTDATLTSGTDKKIFLFHADPFTSLGNPANESFCLFDNLIVTELPAPTSAQEQWTLYQ